MHIYALDQKEIQPISQVFQGNNWLIFMMISIIYILSTFINMEWVITDESYYNSYGEQIAFDRIAQMLELQSKWKWLAYILTLLIIPVRIFLLCICLLAGDVWEAGRLGFNRLWSLSLRAEIISAFAGLLSVLFLGFVLKVDRLEDIAQFHGFSLLSFFDPGERTDIWYLYPLRVLNVFEAMYWAFLVWGIQKLSSKSFGESLNFLVLTYGMGLCIWILFVVFIKLNSPV